MRTRILALLTVGLVAGPVTAGAAVVTWEMRGTLDFVSTVPPPFTGSEIGDPFVAQWSFNTNATLLRIEEGGRFEPGRRFTYDPESLRANVRIADRDPVEFLFQSGSFYSLFLVRDNSGDITSEGVIDGYSVGIPGSASFIQIIMRGPVLDIVDGPGLPATPDPRLADLAVSGFYLGFVDSEGGITGSIQGDFDTVRSMQAVPEPGTLALLGLGLAGLGLSRRRRTE